LCRPSIGIKFQDYVWVELGHGGNQRCPSPASYLFLEVGVLIVPELDASLSLELPSFDGLEMLLVLSTPEAMAVILRSGTGPFSRFVLPGSLCRKLSRSHFLQGQTFWEVSFTKKCYFLKQKWHV